MSLPYETATAGDRALLELQKALAAAQSAALDPTSGAALQDSRLPRPETEMNLSNTTRHQFVYHHDPAINAEIEADVLAAEQFDLAHGYPPRWWVCPECGASHHRGHFMSIGVHRCLACGYSGTGGRMHINPPRPL